MSQKLPETEKATQQASRRETQSASIHSFQGGLHPILQLQRTLGNRHVAQLIKARRLTPGGSIIGGRIITLQPKLTVGAADDQYEQEADRVARQVVSMPDSAILPSSPQTSSVSVEGDAGQHHTLQSKPLPLAASITPFVQRQIGTEEESEEGQDKEEDKEGLLQAKFFSRTAAFPLRRQSVAEGEEAEEAQPIQARSAGSLSDSFEVGDEVESRLNQSKGGGSQLPDSVRDYMEPRFGVDFSHVRVHTGSDAIQMNRDVGAQAFTHGSDIYYGARSSPGNQELTAHEAADVIQQRSGIVLKGNIGSVGDPYERHADAVANLVIRGESAKSLLDTVSASNYLANSRPRVQRNGPEDAAVAGRTLEQREALIEAVLEAIAANEVGGRARAVESGLGTSSGRAASYASATQMIPAHALGVLRHEPEYAAAHGLDSHSMERVSAIDRAVRAVWTAIVENQIDVSIVETRYGRETAIAHLTHDDLTAMQRFGVLRAEIGRHVRQIPLEGGQEGQTRRVVVTEFRILAELTTQREAALMQLARMIASESPAEAGAVEPARALETLATLPVEAEAPETATTETSEARAAIDTFPIERRPWPQVVPGPPAIPRRLLDRPARGRHAFRSRRAQRVQWLQGLSRRLAAINLVAEARRISQQVLAAELHPIYEGLGNLRERDVAAYARGNVRGTAAVWREDLNGWIRLALSRERTQPDGPTLDDVIASAASHEGGYALSRLEYQRVISEYLDAHPTATDRVVVLVAARHNAAAADYFSRIWPHFQRLRRERAAREAASMQ